MSRWLPRVRLALRGLRRKARVEQELDDELRFHLDCAIQEGLRNGLTTEQARTAGLRAMGAIEKNKEECRDLRFGQRIREFLRSILTDLIFGWRLFRRHPAPVGIAIGGLALAIGVVTGVFSIVNATLLRPYGMDDPASVVRIGQPGHRIWLGSPYADYLRMRQGMAFGAIEAALPRRAEFAVSAANDHAREQPLLFVSGGYLSMLGGRPALGRTLGPGDDAPGAPPVVVVSHHIWSTVLNGDPAVVGRPVWVNGAAATLVGVLQPDFTGPEDSPPSVWAPLAAVDDLKLGSSFGPDTRQPVQVIARLNPGTDRRAAQDNLNAIAQNGSADSNGPRRGVQLHSAATPISGQVDGDTYTGLAFVFGLVGLVLALACANASNLLLAAAVTRIREVGVRLAVGATRRRLVRQMMSESLLLGVLAGALGLLLAIWLVPLFAALIQVPPGTNLAVDTRVLLFTIAVAVLCGLGTGISPARYGARGHLLVALQSQTGVRGGGGMPSRLRTTFIGFQAAVAILLLVVAALLTRAAILTTRADVGFDADHLLVVNLEPVRAGVDHASYLQSALTALRTVPAVEQVSVTWDEPLGGRSVRRDRFDHNGRSYEIRVLRADARFISTLGVRVLRGRGFTDEEVVKSVPVALISAGLARAFFHEADPVGQSLATIPASAGERHKPRTIVGVVADATFGQFQGEMGGAIYLPMGRTDVESYTDQMFPIPPSLIVRSATPGTTARVVQSALERVDSGVRPTTSLVRERFDAYHRGNQALAVIVGSAAITALLLATLGVYGVTTFVIGQRMEEVSVRMAMGATGFAVLRTLGTDSLRPVLVGLAAGLFVALVASRMLARPLMLSGISWHDPLSVGVALGALLSLATIAVVIPSRKAARTDPGQLLRQA